MPSDAGRLIFARPLATLSGILVLGLAGCSGDDNPPGPHPRAPHRATVQTAAEFASALEEAVAGDTIEIEGGFSSAEFMMDRGFRLEAGTSPLLFQASPRSILRPEIVFPAGSDGLTFAGHAGTRLINLALRGGRSTIVIENSRVALDTLTITDPARDGIEVTGSGSTGRIRGCLIEFVPVSQGGAGGRFGVSTVNGARPTIENNTIVEAGDCGLYVGGNSIVRANNIYRAHNFGAYFDEGSVSPTVGCNNAWLSTNGNYVSARGLDLSGNKERDPFFCPDSWHPQDFSPLAPLNSGGCGLIGAFMPEQNCVPPPNGRF